MKKVDVEASLMRLTEKVNSQYSFTLVADFLVLVEKKGKVKQKFFHERFSFLSLSEVEYLEKISREELSQLVKNSVLRRESVSIYELINTLRTLWRVGLEPEIDTDQTVQEFIGLSLVRSRK